MIVNIKICINSQEIDDATTPEAAKQVGEMLGTVFADYILDDGLIAGTYRDNLTNTKGGLRRSSVEISWHDGMD